MKVLFMLWQWWWGIDRSKGSYVAESKRGMVVVEEEEEKKKMGGGEEESLGEENPKYSIYVPNRRKTLIFYLYP